MTNSTIARYKRYAQYGYYRRSRRAFRPKDVSYYGGVARDYRPTTTMISPDREDQIYGPRTGFRDRQQGIFGYFFGGGWVFGHIENDNFRASSASIDKYRKLPSDQNLFVWLVDDNGRVGCDGAVGVGAVGFGGGGRSLGKCYWRVKNCLRGLR